MTVTNFEFTAILPNEITAQQVAMRVTRTFGNTQIIRKRCTLRGVCSNNEYSVIHNFIKQLSPIAIITIQPR